MRYDFLLFLPFHYFPIMGLSKKLGEIETNGHMRPEFEFLYVVFDAIKLNRWG